MESDRKGFENMCDRREGEEMFLKENSRSSLIKKLREVFILMKHWKNTGHTGAGTFW